MSTALPSQFVFDIPTRIEFGIGIFKDLGKYVEKFGKNTLIVSYKDKSLHGLVESATQSLESHGIKAVVFEEVVANPTNLLIDQGAQLSRENDCDVIIGLGGGSAIDVAKAISVAAVENVPVWDIVEGKQLSQKPLPLIAIPTTSGTGSEATQYAVISNRELKRKEGIGKKEFYPRVSILDPELTLGLPASITAATGLDALTHAIEGYTTKFTNPITDALAERSIELIYRSIFTAFHNGNDILARSDLQLGSMIAGMVITHTDTSLAHVIGEATGAFFNTNHGLSVALTLPAVMEFNLETNLEKFARIAQLLGEDSSGKTTEALAREAPEAFRKIIRGLRVPEGLMSLGVTENEHVLELCTRPGWDAANLRPASKEDFIKLIRGSISADMSFWKYC